MGEVWLPSLLSSQQAAVKALAWRGLLGCGSQRRGWPFCRLLWLWQNSVPCHRLAEVPVSSLAVSWRLLPSPRSHLHSLPRDPLHFEIPHLIRSHVSNLFPGKTLSPLSSHLNKFRPREDNLPFSRSIGLGFNYTCKIPSQKYLGKDGTE